MDILSPDISISPGVIVGVIIAAIGAGLLFILVKAASGGRMLRVPDGTPPDEYYRLWRSGALGKKISRGMIFVAAAALAMVFGGIGAMLIALGG